MQVNYRMVEIARKSRGKNQAWLAKELDVTQGRVSKIEQGLLPITEELLTSLCNVLEYPKEFFAEEIEQVPSNPVFYRRRKTMSRADLDFIDNNLHIRRMQVKKLLKSVDIPDNVPSLKVEDYGTPEKIARSLRLYWKIPAGPINNLAKYLESAGIIILWMATNNKKLDGQFVPDDSHLHIIYLNKEAPGDRQRYSLSHELGHIIMHREIIPTTEHDVEGEADRFAAEFLMPADEIRPQINEYTGLNEFADLKRYWKTSIQALIVRAHRLQLISQSRYKSLYVQLSRYGWITQEPRELAIPQERPKLLKELIDAHLNQLEYSKEDLSKALCILPKEFDSLFDPSHISMRVI